MKDSMLFLTNKEPKIVGHGAKDLTEAPIDGETEPLVGGWSQQNKLKFWRMTTKTQMM